jgi:hypothetical protein
MWRSELPDVRAEYERRADIKKAEHQAMYPEYRFQPVKREEKERLREAKKQEKERRKEAQRRGRANPLPAPAAPQPSRYYAPNPSYILDPLAPYYEAEQRYGPNGPTPPLSAAPSPSDSGVSDLTQSQSRVEESSVSPPAHASPYPQTPSSVYGSPAIPPSSFMATFPDSHSPEPESSKNIDASESEQWKDSQGTQQPSLITTSGNWMSGFGGQGESGAQVSLRCSSPSFCPEYSCRSSCRLICPTRSPTQCSLGPGMIPRNSMTSMPSFPLRETRPYSSSLILTPKVSWTTPRASWRCLWDR